MSGYSVTLMDVHSGSRCENPMNQKRKLRLSEQAMVSVIIGDAKQLTWIELWSFS